MVITDTPDQTGVRYLFNLSPASGRQASLPLIYYSSEHSLGVFSVERSPAASDKHKGSTNAAIHPWRGDVAPVEVGVVDRRTAEILNSLISCCERSRNLAQHVNFMARARRRRSTFSCDGRRYARQSAGQK